MGAGKIKNFLRKYMMLIATVLVVIAFYFITSGQSLNPDSIDRLISQNAYVFVLGTGMLLCILTGGNIDLSVVWQERMLPLAVRSWGLKKGIRWFSPWVEGSVS